MYGHFFFKTVHLPLFLMTCDHSLQTSITKLHNRCAAVPPLPLQLLNRFRLKSRSRRPHCHARAQAPTCCPGRAAACKMREAAAWCCFMRLKKGLGPGAIGNYAHKGLRCRFEPTPARLPSSWTSTAPAAATRRLWAVVIRRLMIW